MFVLRFEPPGRCANGADRFPRSGRWRAGPASPRSAHAATRYLDPIFNVDVQHDVAVLRTRQRTAPAPVLEFRPAAEPLAQGERIYSLGNPLDIGFAVTEGTYNGLVRRSFYPRIFFGGTLNPGMSGGPAVDDAGRVLGVNVAKRLDGEQVSFLIPAEFAQALVQRAASAQPITQPAHKEVARQLLVHQQRLTERFLQTPFQEQRHGNYLVPVPDDALARCWGSAARATVCVAGVSSGQHEVRSRPRSFIGAARMC